MSSVLIILHLRAYLLLLQLDLRSSATWDSIRDASKNGDVCSQYDSLTATLISSEDCFYLNVYISYDIHGTTNNLVMIWIHDGSFITGIGNDTKQQYDYLLTKKIILVSISYRLGAFDFLNLGHKTTSGNQDQMPERSDCRIKMGKRKY
ncbi:hypothetical protein HN011_004050 [Eciton burchellii]|nr:hypothetical protein HN011_004050 [Eciton burchellii]